MFVDNDSVISCRERKDKSDYEIKSKEMKYSERESENMVYINVKGRYYTNNPRLITENRMPPPLILILLKL